jgi:hypothetical protein
MSQIGYGANDVVGIPFQFYSGAVGVATGSAYAMTGTKLVLLPAGAVTGVTITLPLNPPDGATVEISNVGAAASTVTGTVSAATGDTLSNLGLTAVTVITPAALATAGTASNTIKYSYTLSGYTVPTTGVVLNARTWFRVQ